MNECGCSVDLQQFVTWMLIILGWLIVSRQNDGREFRREVRSRIDSLSSNVGETADLALAFYSKAGGAAGQNDLRQKLIRLLTYIGTTSSSLVDGDQEHKLIRAALLFRQAITLNDFDSTARQAYTAGTVRTNEIVDGSRALLECLEHCYADRFSTPNGL